LLGFGGFISLFWAQSYRSARRSLQDTSAFADEVVTHLPVGLIATDRDGKITFFNAAAEKITGLNLHETRGKDPENVLPSPWCELKEYLDQGETVLEQEMECVFSGQEPVPVSVSATRIDNEEGYFVGNILILRDLGEVRRLQEEVRRKEKLAALGGLAAGVAHEIRNPLSSIKGIASYFGGNFAEGSHDLELAGVMIQEVDRLNRVISELLDFARPSELNLKPTDVNEILKHSTRLVQQDAKTKNIEIHWSGSENLAQVQLDADRFSQCLLNLYLNAIQSMDAGGVLSINCSPGDNENIRMEIADTGKGIRSSDLKKIFDPYFTTKSTGTGLGLAIVHKIIEAHQGNIKVTSTPGKGTVFTIFIPIRPDESHKKRSS
jgi:two-component system sensor histidine kinase HydH